MDCLKEDRLLLLELQTLMKEVTERCDCVMNDDYAPRRTFAFAQVVGTRDLMKYLAENKEWEDFGQILEATLDGEESRYFEAMESGDRQLRTIVLANQRLLKRLIRRLTDPRRRQLLLSQLDSNR